MGVKITGLDKLKKNIERAVKKVPLITATEYKKEIIKNLKPSKKTGALMNSFVIKRRLMQAIIVSDLPYARIQDEGGRIRITDAMRRKMWALYKQYKLPVYKAIAITKKSFITIPAKNYTEINEKSLIRKVDREFNKITKRI